MLLMLHGSVEIVVADIVVVDAYFLQQSCEMGIALLMSWRDLPHLVWLC